MSPAAAGTGGEDLSANVTASDIRRFRAEEERALAGLAGWIGHPAIAGIIRQAVPSAAAAVEPVRRHLADQVEVIGFSWFVMEIAAIQPGWTIASHIWQLTPQEHAALAAVKAAFRAVVTSAADTLTAAGVPLVPSWPGDLAVVAELLLLEVIGINVPWDTEPRELADLLQPPPASAIEADAGGTRVRRGTSERGERDATGLRRGYEVHLHGRQPAAPYAGGGRRAVPEPTQQRRDALRQVLAAFPDVSAAQIQTTYQQRARKADQTPATPGGYLRALLGNVAPCPARSTLAADLAQIRRERPAAAEDLPG